MIALGNFFFRFRTTISPLLLPLLFLPGEPIFEDPFTAAVVGLLVAAAGQVVRWTTIGYRYIVRGGRGHRVYADDLVVDGLFRHTRNPMYLGKFFMILGAAIASNRWPAAIAIAAAYGFMYQAVTLAEEDYLRNKFGAAFDEYCARVPRWIPRFAGLGATLSGATFNWRRVLGKGYSEPLGWTLPIVLVSLYNISADPAPEPRHRTALLAVLVAALAVWLTAGFFKRIKSPFLRATDN
jgi:protein-S-isoprenylcysteine O-methyltransferase Ste14